MLINRRELIAGSAGAAAVALARIGSARQAPSGGVQPVRISVDPHRRLGVIPADFTGLGYEISSVSKPGLLSAQNHVYVQLVRTLGAAGVIRIGGNTSDFSTFASQGQAVSTPEGTVVNAAGLRDLGTFLDATGWTLIWGLNLGRGSEQQAVEEAQAVAAAVKDKLLAFEIGNETDLFGRGKAVHRPHGYSYEDYLKEYRRYKAAIRAVLPNAPFAGPDVASATDWVTRFATDEGNDLKLLTHHYYRECANPSSTLDKLLNPDPKLALELATLKAASLASRVPYRICETNSFCGGGKPGVSDTFGAALWVLDFMFAHASADCVGVNIETGVNQLDFISSYSPIGEDGRVCSAKPDYYGMLAFAQGSHGQRVALSCDAGGVNLNAYAVLDKHNHLSITIINKDISRDAAVSITSTENLAKATALRLSAPSLNSKDGVTLGGAAVTANGEWKPSFLEPVSSKGGKCEIRIPAASAAVLKW